MSDIATRGGFCSFSIQSCFMSDQFHAMSMNFANADLFGYLFILDLTCSGILTGQLKDI